MEILILILCTVFCTSEHVPDITNRVDRMEREMKKEIDGLRSELSSLVKKNEMLTKGMATLQVENSVYRHELSKHKDIFAKLETVNDEQNITLKKLQDNISYIFADNINRLSESGRNGLSESGRNENLHSRQAVSQTWNVAFHANVNGAVGLNDNEVIRFDRVLTNIGAAYDGHVGLFQSPTPGTYVFFVNFLIYQNKRLEAQIVKDGNVIQNVYAGTSDTGTGPGSNMVIVKLNQGDRVWVKVHDKYHDTGDILDGPWCTFNGFLLYADD